jgi:integrase
LQERAVARETVAWLLRRWLASSTDVSAKAREQYAWAIGHIAAELGAVRLDRLDRDDIARWLEATAAAGRLSRKSIEICRTVLKAALTDAVDEGLLRRNPAARVPMPRPVSKPGKVKAADAWSEPEVDRFLEMCADHRWAVGFHLAVLYGLRRREVLALRWDDSIGRHARSESTRTWFLSTVGWIGRPGRRHARDG